MTDLAHLSYWQRKKLERYQAALARLEREQQRSDAQWNELSRYFHLGTVGGSGRNVRHLDRKREASIEREINRGKKIAYYRGQIAHLTTPPEPRVIKPRKPVTPRAAKPLIELTLAEFQLYEWYQFSSSQPSPVPGKGDADVPQLDEASYWHNRAVHGITEYERDVWKH